MGGRGASGARSASGAPGALIGRDDLLTELEAAARAAVAGQGSLVLLTGEAGIGKTSVARTLAALARDDLDVSWGACIADGSAPPFWPWRGIVDVDSPDPARTGPEPWDRAAGAERFELLNELRAQLFDRAGNRPLLHVIEDLQWADVASVLLLVHLGTAVASAPLLVVATLRTGEPSSPQLEDAIEEVRRAAVVRAVSPLGDREVAALVKQAGLGGDPALVVLLRERTGGNPLFLTELLRSVRAGDAQERLREALMGGVPDRVAGLVARQLARLPPAVAEIALAASVIGTEVEAATLASVRGIEPVEVVLDLLEQARAAHLVETVAPGRWQFRHDLVRDAVYRSMPDAERARRHAEVLEALATTGDAAPPILAHHALAARPLLDADRAVALAASAGASAFAQHAYEEAVAWCRRALAEAPASTGPRWRAELLARCGEAHRHIGEMDAAREAFAEAAEATDDPGILARAALGYADPGADLGIAYRTEDPRTGALLDRAIAAQPAPDSVTTVLLEARLAAELHFSDDPGRAGVLARSAVDRATRLGDGRALVAATAVFHDAFVVGHAPPDDLLRGSARLLEWARSTGAPEALLTAHRARVLDLLAAGDLASMDAEILAFRRVADPLGVPAHQWWPAVWSAMRALLEGHHDLAEARAHAAYELGARQFPSLALLNLSFLLFFLRREQGRLAEMEQLTRDYVASQADVPALRVGLALLLAELDRHEEAQGLATSLQGAALADLHDRNWPASWFQLARVAHLVGDRALAITLLEDPARPRQGCVTVSLATVCLGAVDLATAWLLHTAGDLDSSAVAYESAARVNARIGARGWLAQSQVDHARLRLDRGRPGDHDTAERLVELAAATAEDIGLASISAAVQSVRARPAGGDPTVAPAARATFRRAGGVWELDFAGRSVQVPHARGLSDLAQLLARPGQAVSVLELLDDPASVATGDRGAPALDERARREIRARLHELDAEEADAEASGDGERAALAREQRQQLAESVARDLGLGGRSRRIGDPVERARKTVSTRIRRAVTSIGRTHPELGRHLDRSIDTGAWCAYRPAEPVTWST